MTEKLYDKVARQLRQQIANGTYQAGERLPGVRKLKTQCNVSASTILTALAMLEAEGLIEAKPRSGNYVKRPSVGHIAVPGTSQPELIPQPISSQQLTLNLVKASHHPDILQLGTAVPADCFLPTAAIGRSIARVSRRQIGHSNYYEFPPGNLELRRQISKRMLLAGCQTSPDEIVITSGCQEAICLALRAVAKPGDVIAVESPTFYGLLQAIDFLDLKALEIPTDPIDGLNIPALQTALEQWNVKACVMVSNYSNPLGHCMTDSQKKQLVQLLAEQQVPLIENDIYGDLGFENQRPPALKAFDEHMGTIYCSSFSKTISPGLRVGWIIAPQHSEKIEYSKYVNSLSTPTLSQRALAHYLQHESHDRFLRNIRAKYRYQVQRMVELIYRHFPQGTRVTQPSGGFVVWLELPVQVNALELYHLALESQISIAPGQVFSARHRYEHFIRINCAIEWNEKATQALILLSQLISKLASN